MAWLSLCGQSMDEGALLEYRLRQVYKDATALADRTASLLSVGR